MGCRRQLGLFALHRWYFHVLLSPWDKTDSRIRLRWAARDVLWIQSYSPTP
jgi:hypothetical protein